MKKTLFILYLIILLSFSAEANEYLYGEFIHNLNLDMRGEPFPGNTIEEFENIIPEEYEKAVFQNLLEEARWIFSGMIYGFELEYTPSDINRTVERYCQIDPIAQIVFGDPRLEIYDSYLENNLFHIFIRYRLDDFQVKRIEYWGSGIFNSVAAYGRAPIFSENSRISSIKDGIRISLENYLKPLEYNKPSSIKAQVLLRESPSIMIDSGDFRAFVKLRLNIKSVQHYRLNN